MPEPAVALVACPCCLYPTLPERGGFDICPVCFWEDEWPNGYHPPFGPDDPSPANGMTLNEGRALYERIGATRADLVAFVRPPTPDEQAHREALTYV